MGNDYKRRRSQIAEEEVTMTEMMPMCSIEAERAVLGACLFSVKAAETLL